MSQLLTIMVRRYSIASIVLALVIAGSVFFWVERRGFLGSVPGEFTNARMQGAMISENIVSLSNNMTGDLAKINELDQQKNYTDALALTSSVIKQSQDIRTQAVGLSAQLETMAKTLPNVKSAEARQAALEAIADRLALISRLVNYTGYLENLLAVLREHFASGASSDHVSALVDQINSEVTAINNFNRNATESMNRFDTLINK